MYLCPITENDGPGAWLINKDEAYRFDDIDDPYDSVMLNIYELGGVVVFWDGEGARVCFNIEHCRYEGMKVAVGHSLYPLTLIDVAGKAPRRKARTREEAEAICTDLLMYRSLAVIHKTVVIDRPESQIASSSDLLKSTIQAWKGNAAYDYDKLIKMVATKDGLVIDEVGSGSLAAQHLGTNWALSMQGTPALPESPNQYERAVYDGYKTAMERGKPVLQDVHAKLETDNGVRNESYRRLVVPVSGDGDKAFLLVASEVIEKYSTPHGLPE